MSIYPNAPTGRLDGRLLTIERTFRAPIDDVWASLTEPERVARWYGIIDGDLRPGQTISITLTSEDGAPSEPVDILECEPPNRFVIETAGIGDPWRLQIELAETNGITTMTFSQELAADLDAGDIGAGWEFYADRHDAAFNDNAMPDWEADRYQEIHSPHYADTANQANQ